MPPKKQLKSNEGASTSAQYQEEEKGKRKQAVTKNIEIISEEGNKIANSLNSLLEGKYSGSGLKKTLHGTAYQLKLLMLQFLIANESFIKYSLSTEWDEGVKFDDLIFQYKTTVESNFKFLFLQAKHVSDVMKKDYIIGSEFFKKGQFYLVKYLYAYFKIIKKFPSAKEFILCTNKRFKFLKGTQSLKFKGKSNDLQINLEPAKCDLELVNIKDLTTNKKIGKHYRIKRDDNIVKEILASLEIGADMGGYSDYDKIKKKIDAKIVEDFLDELIFAVEQPSETELDKIINKRMSKKTNLTVKVAELGKSHFQVWMLNWFKERNCDFLNKKDFDDFFVILDIKLHHFKMIGLTDDFTEKLKSKQITFKNFDFIPSDKNLIVLKMPQNLTVLGSIAVYQKFNRTLITLDGSFIFLNAESFKVEEEKKLKCLEDEDVKLLAIEFDNFKLDQNYYNKFLNFNKKIILIASEVEEGFENKDLTQENLINYIADASLEKLLNTDVNFQEYDIKFLCLLNNNTCREVFNNETLAKLIKGEKILISSPIAGKNFDPDLYIPRTLFLDSYLPKYTFEINDLIKKIKDNNEKKVMLIYDVAGMGKSTELTHLGIELKKKLPHYWVLKIELGNKTCEEAIDESKGNLLKFLNFYQNDDFEKRLFEKLFNAGRVIILLDGYDEIKSKYIEPARDLIRKFFESNFNQNQVILTSRFNCLNELTKIGEDVNNKIKEKDFKPFNNHEEYKIKSFEQFEQKQLLVSFWLSIEALEGKKTELEEFADELIKKWKQSIIEINSDFLGIPLQTRMLAEIFQQVIIKSYEIGKKPVIPTKLSLVGLFKKFFDLKYEVFTEKSSYNDIKVGIMSGEISVKRSHLRIALELLIPSEFNKIIQIDDIKITLTYEQLLDVGFIKSSSNRRLRFSHRAFAEFYVGEYFYKKIVEQQEEIATRQEEKIAKLRLFIVEELFLNARFETISTFMNALLQIEKEISIQKLVEIFSPSIESIKLKGIKQMTKIHNSISRRQVTIFKILWHCYVSQLSNKEMSKIIFNINENTSLLDLSLVNVEIFFLIWDFVKNNLIDDLKKLLIKGKIDLLYLAILTNNNEILHKIFNYIGSLSIENIRSAFRILRKEETILHRLVESGNVKNVKIFFEFCTKLEKQDLIKEILENKDFNRQTPFFYPVFQGNYEILEILLDQANQIELDTSQNEWQKRIWLGKLNGKPEKVLITTFIHKLKFKNFVFDQSWIINERILCKEIFQNLIKQRTSDGESLLHSLVAHKPRVVEKTLENIKNVFSQNFKNAFDDLMNGFTNSPLTLITENLPEWDNCHLVTDLPIDELVKSAEKNCSYFKQELKSFNDNCLKALLFLYYGAKNTLNLDHLKSLRKYIRENEDCERFEECLKNVKDEDILKLKKENSCDECALCLSLSNIVCNLKNKFYVSSESEYESDVEKRFQELSSNMKEPLFQDNFY